MIALPFIKMHGLGNDFVVLDGRRTAIELAPDAIRAIADRRTGVGCDQLIVIGAPSQPVADIRMRIFNADGGEVAACGNASRCIAHLVMNEDDNDHGHAVIETAATLLACNVADHGRVTVDLGPAHSDWRSIPLAREADTLHLPLAVPPLADAVAVEVGNPHAVFFVDDAEAVPLAACGPRIECDPLFPERTNVEVVQVLAPDRLRLRVWERGVGITRACGTGAAAAVVAAHRRGLAGRAADVILDGGTLSVEWRADGHVLTTGPVATSFRGTLDPGLLG
ncbi:MAG: diaminopimelate epimerase [Rhodospirillales bacterium]